MKHIYIYIFKDLFLERDGNVCEPGREHGTPKALHVDTLPAMLSASIIFGIFYHLH